MPRLLIHSYTISLGGGFAVLVVAMTLSIVGCRDVAVHDDPTWNEHIAEEERIVDAAKGDSIISRGDAERTVTYYIAGEPVKKEYHYHGRLVSCFNYADGKLNGYGIEWNRDGTLYFVAHYVDGKLDGPVEQHERAFGFKTLQVYRMGELLSSDTLPLTDIDSPGFARDLVTE